MRAFRTRIYRVRDINRARIYACMYLFRASPRGHLERVHSIVHLDTVHSIVHMDRVSLPGCFCTGLFARISRPRFITRAQGMHAYYQTCTPRVHSGETCSMWTLERGAIFWGQLQMDYGAECRETPWNQGGSPSMRASAAPDGLWRARGSRASLFVVLFHSALWSTGACGTGLARYYSRSRE